MVAPNSPRRAVVPWRTQANRPVPIRPSRLRLPAVLVAVASAVSLLVSSVSPGFAAEGQAIQNVSVQVGPDGTVTALSSVTAARGQSGATAANTVGLDPLTDGLRLPVRVSTAWWAGGTSGTNLALLKGMSGRVRIDVSVENLTLAPREVTVEDKGAKYRTYALIGVPLTVVASTTLGKNDLPSVVVGGQGDVSTNGVVSQSGSGAAVVQWAAMLAPPLLAPTATFTLVMDVKDFNPPNFDLMVQAGLLTDPSLQEMLAASMGWDSASARRAEATLNAVMNVTSQVQQGQDLIDQVYAALSKDASQLGTQTYSSLQSSSSAMLSQIESTKATLAQLITLAQQSTGSAQSQVSAGLTALLARLNADVLGSPDADLKLDAGVVDGCSVTFPKLPDDAPRTLSTAVRLIQAQLGTIIGAFGESDPAGGQPNCRAALTQMMTDLIGEPSTDCTTSSSVRCVIVGAQDRLASNSQRLGELKTTLATQMGALGVTQLSTHVQALYADMQSMSTQLEQLSTDLDNGSKDVSSKVDALLGNNGALAKATQGVESVRGLVDGVLGGVPGRVPLSDVQTSLAALSSSAAHIASQVTTYQSEVDRMMKLIGGDAQDILKVLNDDGTKHGLETRVAELLTAWNNMGGVAQGLPADWRETLISLVDQETVGYPSCRWNSAGFPPVGDPTRDAAIQTALNALAKRPAGSCPAASLGGLLASLFAYQTTMESNAGLKTGAIPGELASVGSLASKIQNHITDFKGLAVVNDLSANMNDLRALSRSLSDNATALQGIETDLRKVPALLDSLWVDSGGTQSGFLATMKTGLQSVHDAFDTGDMRKALNDVNQLRTLMGNVFTDKAKPTDGCPGPGEKIPRGAGSEDSVVWLSTLVACNSNDLTNSLDEWFRQAAGVYAGADKSLSDALAYTDQALKTSVTQVDQMSDAFQEQLTQATSTMTADQQAAIEQARKDNEEAIKVITASFTQSSDAVVVQLTNQVNTAVADADAAKTRLQEQFNTVLANLGSPDEASRTGLLGMLRGAATTTGDTVTTLDTVTQSTTTQASSLSAQLLVLQLTAAEYQAAQARIGDLAGFPGVPAGVSAVVVFSYHVSGK